MGLGRQTFSTAAKRQLNQIRLELPDDYEPGGTPAISRANWIAKRAGISFRQSAGHGGAGPGSRCVSSRLRDVAARPWGRCEPLGKTSRLVQITPRERIKERHYHDFVEGGG